LEGTVLSQFKDLRNVVVVNIESGSGKKSIFKKKVKGVPT